MAQAQPRDSLCHAGGFGVVNRQRRAFGHSAESAAARAQVAQHHEGCGAVVPALADVGAIGAFADGMQVQISRQFFQRVEGLAHGRARFQPGRLGGRAARGQINLHQICCNRAGRGGHLQIF